MDGCPRGEGDGPGERVQSRVVLSLLLSQQGVICYVVVPYARCDSEGMWRGKQASVFLRLEHFFSLGCSPRSRFGLDRRVIFVSSGHPAAVAAAASRGQGPGPEG